MSDESEDEDLGAMAWPGFVDILSSVIIMFVFFVMVVASALYFHIIIFKSKILAQVSQSISAESTMQELATTNRAMAKKIEEMTEQMKILEQINEDKDIQLFKEDSGFAESREQEIHQDMDENIITIYFGKDSISVTEDSKKEIARVIEMYGDKYSEENMKVSIISNKNPDSVNDIISRRLAIARMLNVRNLFLTTEVPKDQVNANIVEDEPINDTYNWVQIKFEKK